VLVDEFLEQLPVGFRGNLRRLAQVELLQLGKLSEGFRAVTLNGRMSDG
jgi:hypothetical protein